MENDLQVILTAKDSKDRLAIRGSVSLSKDKSAAVCDFVELDVSKTFQVIKGFGGAFTEAGAYVLSQIPPEKKDEVLRAYFDEVDGLGYSLCRTHINSCDFSLSNYSYDDIEGDYELKHFNIAHDKKFLIPFIKDAMRTSQKGFKLFASPWSPPAWMKTNSQMNNGGKLKTDCYNAWALYFTRYIKAYLDAGISISAVTVQNEPDAVQRWDSCIYSNEEERDFLKFYLGPKFAEQGLSHIKIIVWDHNKDILVERVSTILSDPQAAKYVWAVGFHWYAGTYFENLSKVHNFFSDKHLIATEGCHERGVKLGSWQTGEGYGHAIIGDLNNWTAGWVDWNMLLDENGGPNHAHNYCDAPIIADTKTGKLHYQSSYYYLGHFSKFIKPGAIRIFSSASSKHLEVTAFQNQNGSVVTVVMNRTENKIDFCLRFKNYSATLESPSHSIQTLIINRP
ncbi:MAG: glycoside hydrolase family 30 protein [Phycisphaerae bacterium]|jgi:glucosylceramidase